MTSAGIDRCPPLTGEPPAGSASVNDSERTRRTARRLPAQLLRTCTRMDLDVPPMDLAYA